ncbi:MAG: ribosome silencing factor [Bacteroidales bacterium]|jgi:ribosome-associated protein|nr:ribosome silencing factor [Bacteroidales bacterium]
MVKQGNKANKNTNKLVEAIVEGLFKKKGLDVVSLDLTEIENTVCKYFVVCHADSDRQVEALAYSVVETVREETGEKVWHKEGLDTSTWVLLDYADVVVHIFQKDYRDLYKLEELWADAKLNKHIDDNKLKEI